METDDGDKSVVGPTGLVPSRDIDLSCGFKSKTDLRRS